MHAICGGLLLAQATLSAAMACATRADLEAGGIEVEFFDGTRVVYTLSDKDVVLEANFFEDPSENFWVKAYLGLYPLADGSMINGDISEEDMIVSRYPEALTSLPPVAPDLNWSGRLSGFDAQGADTEKTTLNVRVGQQTQFVIGQCTYSAMAAETQFTYSDGGNVAQFQYLPDLGIAIQTASGFTEKSLDEFYRPLSIKALPQ